MCTNFNKACPKNMYSLSNIDYLVDGVIGHKILNFLDAYFGYNQIRMHLRDKEKIMFMINDANYFY